MTDTIDINGATSNGDEKPLAVMRCEDMQALLTDYMSRELGDAKSALVREHLRKCEACQAQAREIADALDMLKAGSTARFPEKLSDRHRARIKRAYTHPFISWVENNHLLVSIIVAAVLVLMVFGFLVVLDQMTEEEPEQVISIRVLPPGSLELDEIHEAEIPILMPTEDELAELEAADQEVVRQDNEERMPTAAPEPELTPLVPKKHGLPVIGLIVAIVAACALLARRLRTAPSQEDADDGRVDEGMPPRE